MAYNPNHKSASKYVWVFEIFHSKNLYLGSVNHINGIKNLTLIDTEILELLVCGFINE